jgi:hypothetical protein
MAGPLQHLVKEQRAAGATGTGVPMTNLLKLLTPDEQVSSATRTAETVPISQRRVLRRLLRDLVAFTGTAITDVAATLRKASRRTQHRLLYHRAGTFTHDEVRRVVLELGPARVLRVIDELTQPQQQPQLPFEAAE